MSLASVWKGFDVDRDTTVFHPVPCCSTPSVLSKGFSARASEGEHRWHHSKAIIFWQTPDELRDTAYFILPKRVILEAAENGSWRVTYTADPHGRAHYALSPRPGNNEALDRFEAGGSLISLPEGCEAGIALGLVEDGEQSYYAFAIESGDSLARTTEAIHAVVAHTRREAYQRLRHLLRGGNATFARNLGRLSDYLPVELKNMRGLPQLPGHYGLDPVEHTLEALKESAKSTTLMERFQEQWAVCREWVRCALIYHDLGKKVNPFNVRHAKLSAKMARFHLRCMGYKDQEEQVVARLVETHDVLGGIKRGRLTVDEGVGLLCRGMDALVPLDRLLDMHYEVAAADIRSIGYLRHISVRDEYLAMRRAIKALGRATWPRRGVCCGR